MTTTRELCSATSAALQVPGVERHAARLVHDGYLPRAGDEVYEDDAAPTPAAKRQRRFRERRRRGDVDEANSSDLDYVGKAIAAAARRSLDLT